MPKLITTGMSTDSTMMSAMVLPTNTKKCDLPLNYFSTTPYDETKREKRTLCLILDLSCMEMRSTEIAVNSDTIFLEKVFNQCIYWFLKSKIF